jgi:acyl-coenzyme A synthetase/AMP-(fatty) acid ligase
MPETTKSTPADTSVMGRDIQNWTLAGLLDAASDQHGDQPFLVGATVTTFRQAAEHSRRIAAWLRNKGVKRGDRVVICASNRPEVALVAFAAARLGAIFAVINNQIKAHGFRQIFQQCEPTIVVLDETSLALSAETGGSISVLLGGHGSAEGVPFAALLAMEDPGLIPFAGIDLDPACLVFTSGSTGTPRGVILSHDNVRFVTRSIQERLGYRPADIVGVFLPLAFDYGLYQIFLAAQAGASLYMGRPEMVGPEILKILATQRITVLPGVPTLFAAMLKMLERRPHALPDLKKATNTGEKLPRAHVDQLLKLFPQLQVFLMFGLTECKRVSIMLPGERDARPDSVGRPLAGTEVFVVDERGHRLPPGQTGELVVRGRHVALGYWRAEEETRQRFRIHGPGLNRELHCGDSCKIDEEGFIDFYGRNDHLIKHRGFRMSPLEVEEAVCSIPGVSEAGMVKSGETDMLHLFMSVNDPALTVEHVRTELLLRLEPVKMPDRIIIIAELPKTMNRKIDRKALSQKLTEGTRE